MERILFDYCLKKIMQLLALLAMRWQPRLDRCATCGARGQALHLGDCRIDLLGMNYLPRREPCNCSQNHTCKINTIS